MADQDIQIGADASAAVSEFAKFEAQMLKQAEQLEKLIGLSLNYNKAGELMEQTVKAQTKDGALLTLQYQNVDGVLTKTAESLSKAATAMGKFDTAAKKSKTTQKDFANAQALVTASLGREFSALPEDATSSSIESLEREKNRLAKLIAGSKVTGGAQKAIEDSLAQAFGGIFSDEKGIAGKIQRQVFNILEARKRVAASSPSVLAATREPPQLPIITEETKAILDQAEAQRILAEAKKKADAAFFRNVINDKLGVNSARTPRQSRPQFAASEKSINTIRQQLEGGILSLNRAEALLDAVIGKKQVLLADTDEKKAFSAFQQLSNQVEDYNRKLQRAIQLRDAARAERAFRQGGGNLQSLADSKTNNLRLALQFAGLNQANLNASQNATFTKSLATVNAGIRDQTVTAQRALEIFTLLQQKKEILFQTPKEKGVISAFAQLLNLVDQVNKVSKPGKVDTFDKVGQAALASKLQSDTLRAFGGVQPGASQAQLVRIQAASNALGRFVQTSRISEAQFAAVMDAFLKDATVTFTGVEGQALKAMRSVSQALKTTQTPMELFGLTWTNLTKLFAVQVIHSAISRVIGSIEQATLKAVEFNVKIAEIRTLTEGNAISSNAWAISLREVSDSFGIDLIDTAAAAYDILSNQVAKGTNAIGFLKEAAVFAKITVSSLQDSVNLLSAAVNAYRNQSLTASRASEILFAVIDLGKVRVDEIANTFGNVAILAAQVGISFEELGATFAAITIQGTRSDTAMTLLNNVILKLLKPTGEIKALMRSWGVDTGQAAIRTFGFVGVLEKLNAAVEAGTFAFDDANETRAIRGFLASASDSGLDIVEENVRKLNDAAANKKRAEEIARNSPGALFQKELTQFSNVLTQDVGKKIFETFVQISQAMGGVKNLLNTLVAGFQGPIAVVTNFAGAIAKIVDAVSKFPGGGLLRSLGLSGVSAALSGVITSFAAYRGMLLLTNPATLTFAKNLKAVFLQMTSTTNLVKVAKGAWALLGGELKVVGLAANAVKVNLAAITLGLPFLIGAFTALETKAEAARIEMISLSKIRLDEFIQQGFDAKRSGFSKVIEQQTKDLQERNKATDLANAELKAKLYGSVVEVTENVKRQQALISQTGFSGELSFDFLINGKKSDPESGLKEIADGIKKSIDEAIKLEAQLSKLKFESSLIGADPFAATESVFARIESLQSRIGELFDSRNMDGVRDTFKEINDLIKEQLVGREGLDATIQKTKDQLEELQIGDSASRKREAGEAAESRGLALLNVGNLQAANAEFAKADRYFSSLNSQGKSFDSKLQKLGIRTPSRQDDDALRIQQRIAAFENLKASPNNPEKQLTDLLEKQLKLEQKFQVDQTKKLVDNKQQLDTITASTNAITQQISAQQELGQVLEKNFSTQNQTLTVLNEQLSALQKIAQTIVDDNTTGGFTFNNNIVVLDEQLQKTVLLHQQMLAASEAVTRDAKAFDENQNSATLGALKASENVLNQRIAELESVAVGLELALKKAHASENGTIFADLLKLSDEEGNAVNPDSIFRNGENAGEALRRLRESIEASKADAEKVREAQDRLLNPKTSALNNGLSTEALTAFGSVGEEVFTNLAAQIGLVVDEVRDLNTELARPNLLPTQLGQGRFSSGIANVSPIAPASQSQGGQQINIGDVIVQVQEVVDGKIDPVELGNALRRGIRQGLIQIG